MRLISFLGTGNYGETTYSLSGEQCKTKFVAQALATFSAAQEVHLIATVEAEKQHGEAICSAFASASLPPLTVVPVPTGGAADQLWILFSAIVESIRTSTGPVMIDITHGFRMQPFFAAACIQYVQAVLPNPPTIRVVYGEYRRDEPESPIWELTPFLEVLSWSRGFMMFLKTGLADDAVRATNELQGQQYQQWLAAGKIGSAPRLKQFAQTLKNYSDDFSSIRTKSLLIDQPSNVARLRTSIDQLQDDLRTQAPALGLVLSRVQDLIAPMTTDGDLTTHAGQTALIALAKLYKELNRLSESASVLCEGWITAYIPDVGERMDLPLHQKVLNQECRETAKSIWNAENQPLMNQVTTLRNDLQHGGFNEHPSSREKLRSALADLISQWESFVATRFAAPPSTT